MGIEIHAWKQSAKRKEREREGERGARQREAARVLKLRIPGAPDQTAMAMPRRTGEHL